MEQIINDRRRRRSKEEILNKPGEFEKANVSVTEFCLTHNISKANFHKWQGRYKTKKPVAGFVPVRVTSAIGSVTLFAEVRGVKIYQPVTAAYLKELLA